MLILKKFKQKCINFQSLIKLMLRLGYGSLIIAIFVSIWMFKGFGDGVIEVAEIGLKAFQFLRNKCKNIHLDYSAHQAIFNGII